MQSQLNSSRFQTRARRSLPFVLFVGFLLLMAGALQPIFFGYAAPAEEPAPAHRTPTRTPTPTDSAVGAQQAEDEEVGIDPFLGIGSGVAFSRQIPNFCDNSVVTENGEAWVIPKTKITVGGTNAFDPDAQVLFVQRCVGDFQGWTSGPTLLLLPTLVPVATPAPKFSIAQPAQPFAIARAESPLLERRLDPSALNLATPAPYVPPVLQPVFPTQPPIRVLPTIEAPERFEQLPSTTVTLRTPSGQAIPLDNSASFRPDLWSYAFSTTSETGDYTLMIESRGERQVRTIEVEGVARIFATSRATGAVESSFASAADAVVHYADFQPGREVSVSLYRVVDVPEFGLFSSGALALVDRWRFVPGDQRAQERLALRLRPELGPPFGSFVFVACYVDECNQLPRIDIDINQVVWPQVVLGNLRVEADASALRYPDAYDTIRFAPGAIETTVDLTVSDTDVAGYLLGIRKGQQMLVSVDSENLQVYLLDPDGEILLPTEQTVGLWQFDIAQNGQHALLIYGEEDAHMRIVIPPEGESTGPAPDPSYVVLRPACGERVTAAAGAPIDFRFGIWASRGRSRALSNALYVKTTLQIDGVAVSSGESFGPQPELGDGLCGRDYTDSYWVYSTARHPGLAAGVYDVQVLYEFAQTIADGYGDSYSQPFRQRYTLVVE